MPTKKLMVLTSDEYNPGALPIIRILNRVLIAVGILAIAGLVIQQGFILEKTTSALFNRIDFLIINYYLFQHLVKLFCCRRKFDFLKSHWFESLLALLIILELSIMIDGIGIRLLGRYFTDFNVTEITEIYIGFAQIIIFLTLIIGAIRYNSHLAALKFHPSQTIILSFIFVIFCGAGLLMLPKATYSGHPVSFIDAVFTATSATCVTGLTVVDTATRFTRFGQIIILFLIQIGGLGIMTLSSFLVIFFGKGMGIRERVVISEMLNVDNFGKILNTLRNIMILTFGIEAAGTVLLMAFWADRGWTIGQLFYHSLFHSIAAFCNAGFSTFSDNLCSFGNSTGVLAAIGMLIVLGGLGFIVLTDIGDALVSFIKNPKRPYHLKVQTRIVLVITACLFAGGTATLFLLDTSGSPIGPRLLTAAFNSITTRTAGFNTIDIGQISMSASLAMIFLMFIGASPGSTGGGIKTTTFGILWSSILSIITGKNSVILYKRRMPFVVLNRAIVVFLFSLSVIAIGVFVLSLTEHALLIDILFEVTSAFGTVGLSRDFTPTLSVAGKTTIMLIMLIGRIGTLTLAFAITSQSELTSSRVEYPSESLMVG